MSAQFDPNGFIEPVAAGAAPVGRLDARGPADRLLVRTLRLWLLGPQQQAEAWSALSGEFGAAPARRALRALEEFLGVLAEGARGPIWRHGPDCGCLGRDEALLADAVSAAVRGDFNAASVALAPLIRPEARPAALGCAHRLGRALRAAPRRRSSGGWLH
ncbi:MAG: hypothetical protein ACFCUS_08630 [Rubrimonas sp.]|uniref:hypothetical protein n=1 Tax=Rubrimonas sp. TaxID=2036015 RepID=UPI002FDDC015